MESCMREELTLAQQSCPKCLGHRESDARTWLKDQEARALLFLLDMSCGFSAFSVNTQHYQRSFFQMMGSQLLVFPPRKVS